MSTPQITPFSTALLHDPKQLAAQLQTKRAHDSASEFEASLFGQVLDKMEKSLSIEDESNEDAGHDTWGAMGVQALSQALAQRHVLGISQMIEHSLGINSHSASPSSGSVPSVDSGTNKSSTPLMSLKLSTSLPISNTEGVKETQ